MTEALNYLCGKVLLKFKKQVTTPNSQENAFK